MTWLMNESTRGHERVVRVGGELDLAVAPELRDTLHRMIEEGERQLVLDLSDATFIDSTTIGTLLSALKRARAEEGSLEIVCTNENVLKTFEFAGLDQMFRFHSSLDDALRAAAAI